MSNYKPIMMYPPHSQCPENVDLSEAIEYEKRGWVVDPSHYKLLEAEKAKQKKTKSTIKKSSTTNKQKTVKSNSTSTTKKTVSRTTNKKGETVIKVNKTITIKKQ